MAESSKKPSGRRNVVKMRYVSAGEAKSGGRQCMKVGDDYVYSVDAAKPSGSQNLREGRKRKIFESSDGSLFSTSERDVFGSHLRDLPLSASCVSFDLPPQSDELSTITVLRKSEEPPPTCLRTAEDSSGSIPKPAAGTSGGAESLPRDARISAIARSSTQEFNVCSEGESVRFIIESVVPDSDSDGIPWPTGEIRQILAWWKSDGAETRYLVAMSDIVYQNVIVPRKFFDRRHSYKLKLQEFYESLMFSEARL